MSESSPEDRIYTAAVLIIGNEVLSGRVNDANLHFIATQLKELGVRLREARVIPDDREVIVSAVNRLRTIHDYVFTTGGIGPTHDDITAQCIADAFGVPLERNPDATRILEAYYGDDVNDARLRMANIPVGGTLLDNPVSKAPGFRMDNVFVLPGVPKIMQAMFDGFKHSLVGGRPVLSYTVSAFVAESVAAPGLEAIEATHDGVEIGSYPYVKQKRFGAAFVVRSVDKAKLLEATDAVADLVRALGEVPDISEGEDKT